MKSLTKFGTYGFMTQLLNVQMAAFATPVKTSSKRVEKKSAARK